MQEYSRYPIIFASLVLISACGGGGGGGAAPSGGQSVPGESSSSTGLLKPAASDEELAQNLRSGLSSASYISRTDEFILWEEIAAAPESGDAFSVGGQFTTTNLQETGVDEADIVQYDGEILYFVDPHEPEHLIMDGAESAADSQVMASSTPVIRLASTDPVTATSRALSNIELDSADYSVEGLYLAQADSAKQLIAVGQTNAFVYWALFASEYYWREGRTLVQSWDVLDPTAPAPAWKLEFDGSLLASRRIGNTLYLVTRYSPTIDGLIHYPQDAKDVEGNIALIEQTPIEALLPNVQSDGGDARELLSATDCLVPNTQYSGLTLPAAQGAIITITAVDLAAPDNLQSICLNAYASGFYVSQEAIYFTANISGDATLIHKIKLMESGPVYRGSGKVPGYLGTSNPSFLMSEAAGDLRVVSSTWVDRFFPLPVEEREETVSTPEPEEDFGRHRLTVLRESDDGTELLQIAQLPNSDRPQPIGKPNEDIYAVRFVGARAYIVTFRTIDPLYVIDLLDPEDPQITGELELPGFSTLLQPVGQNLLLGIGYDVPLGEEGITGGVKLALFDVGNVTQPVLLGQHVVGKRGSYSPALDNHHSLSLLERDGKYRAALTIERHAEEVDSADTAQEWRYYNWSDSGLHLFDIDPIAGTLSPAGQLIVDKSTKAQPYSNTSLYNSRSVLHDEAVFMLNNGTIWSQFWGESTDYSQE